MGGGGVWVVGVGVCDGTVIANLQALSPGCIALPLDAFTLFANHLKACGEERQHAQQREQRKYVLSGPYIII